MSASDLFPPVVPISLAEIAALCGSEVPRSESADRLFLGVAALDHAGPDHVSVFADFSETDDLATTRAGACVVAAQHVKIVPPRTVPLVAENPAAVFRDLTASFHRGATTGSLTTHFNGIHPSAIIEASALLEQRVTVGSGAVIASGVEIGAGTIVGANTVLGPGVRIGRACLIDAHVTIEHALIGNRAVVRAGARIGEPADRRIATALGRVIIQDDVEIGANAVIMRGELDDTTIGEGARIGALVVVQASSLVDRHTVHEAR